MKNLVLVLTISTLLYGADTWAQGRDWSDRLFLAFNAGYQTASQGFAVTDSQTVSFEEATAAFQADGKSDFVYDVGGGVRLVGNLGVGASYSVYETTLDSTFELSLPHPLFFNSNATDSLAVPLARKENALHISAIYVFPIASKLQIGVLGGPTRFSYQQESIADVLIHASLSNDLDFNIDLSDPEIENLEGSAWGYHVGADVTYLFNDHIGVGGLVRYARASSDVQNSLETTRTEMSNTSASLDLGGLQVLAGLRIRF